jgi:serine phosphatase RsbU (regulator of sigma subunit)/CheY-like chemotaxis protein
MSTERSMKILIVDDLDVNRDLLLRRMRRMGHEAGEAENGRDALERMDKETWDLVLLDITMPVMDGYETLRHLRADPRHAQTPVVMVSAIDDTESVVRCLELGADDYVTKPFNPIILQARIESSLAKKRLSDQRQHLLAALSREMEIGRRIQLGFLPTTMPQMPGWSLAAFCQPARQVGGDFYDAFELPGQRLAIAVADVCDKGVGAALYMAIFRTMLRTTTPPLAATLPPKETLTRSVGIVNDYIATVHGHESMFATLFFAILDPTSGTLHYLNAGHETPLIRRAATSEVEALDVSGPAVGMMEGMRCSVRAVQLDEGDSLLAYSDGVTEAIGETGEYGTAALRKAVLEHADADAGSLVDALKATLAVHVGDCTPHDDVTVLCLKRMSERD